MKKVLIAHQSTIPHYRIDFYNKLNELKPDNWEFEVVYDTTELEENRFFSEEIDLDSFRFPVIETKTYTGSILGYEVTYQDYLKNLHNYDAVVVEHAFNNVSYPLSFVVKLMGKRYALWGHGKHSSVINPTGIKWFTEKLKLKQVKLSDLYFAYTESVEQYLVDKGISKEKIFTLNNTIDINKQRKYYENYLPQREKFRKEIGVDGKRVLLFVGRINENKKISVIKEAFIELLKKSNDYYLLVIGNGDKSAFSEIPDENCSLNNAITDPDLLAPYYVASDLFMFPGLVGLGPLQAMCYNLPVVTIDSNKHMPEYAYLNEKNSFILPVESTPKDFALQINKIMKNNLRKDHIWKSIDHLTIDNMAKKFIQGINKILAND